MSDEDLLSDWSPQHTTDADDMTMDEMNMDFHYSAADTTHYTSAETTHYTAGDTTHYTSAETTFDPALLLPALLLPPIDSRRQNPRNSSPPRRAASPPPPPPPKLCPPHPYITELVGTHGCIRSNIRYARQLREFWIPTLPRDLRACDVDTLMLECNRLGRRMYSGTEERRGADEKWRGYCAERERVIREAAEPTPSTIAPVALAPPPPPRNRGVAGKQSGYVGQQQQQQQSLGGEVAGEEKPQVYLVMTSYPGWLRASGQCTVIGVVQGDVCY